MASRVQVPLLDHAKTAEELQRFLGSAEGVQALPEQVKKGRARAEAMAEARQAHEAAVAEGKPADTDLLAAYMAYIKVEEVGLLHCDGIQVPCSWPNFCKNRCLQAFVDLTRVTICTLSARFFSLSHPAVDSTLLFYIARYTEVSNAPENKLASHPEAYKAARQFAPSLMSGN